MFVLNDIEFGTMRNENIVCRRQSMFQENRTNELVILKEIAETLNTSNDTYHVLQAVLEKLLHVTGLTTGWIFLADGDGRYTKLIDYRLPAALTFQNKNQCVKGNVGVCAVLLKGN